MNIKSLKVANFAKNFDYEYGIFDSNFVYHGFFNEEELEKLKLEIESLKKYKINVCRIEHLILEQIKPKNYNGIEYKKMYVLLDKPMGNELYSEPQMTLNNNNDNESTVNLYCEKKNNYLHDLELLANATDDQIMKFVTDLYILHRQGIAYDFNDYHRFYYDQEEGFTYLPIGMKKVAKPSLDEFIKGTFAALLRDEPTILLPVRNDFPLMISSFNNDETIQLKYLQQTLLNKIQNSLKAIGVPHKLIDQIYYNKSHHKNVIALNLENQQLANYLLKFQSVKNK